MKNPSFMSPRFPRPILPDAALHGPLGDFWHIIAPHTEADAAAVLFQSLAALGNAIGRAPYFAVESSKHHLNLFVVVVGTTSKGRKGSSWGQVLALLKDVDGDWASKRILSGLSSGEGLINAVRDPRDIVKDGEAVFIDGVSDKRLLVVEGEFGGTLRHMDRDGNTLSSIIRLAWDGAPLRTLTKKSPAQATETHISIIGHVTGDELRTRLSNIEAGNGFANRFLWVSANRSKCLPEGGALERNDLRGVIENFQRQVRRARLVQEIKRDAEARDLWKTVYPLLSEGGNGLVGAVTSRAEAQTMRLACLYALLDGSSVIQRPHLEAALAAWKYCEESCHFIFANASGNSLADDILVQLKAAPNGMPRTMISKAFHGKKKSRDLSMALEELHDSGQARCSLEKTTGRTIEVWFATQDEHGEKREISEIGP